MLRSINVEEVEVEKMEREKIKRGRDELDERDHVEHRTWRGGRRGGGLAQFVFGGWGSVMADICTVHGHLRWFIYPRLPDQASDLPEFVRLVGAPYHTTQFLTFHISSHFQLPVSLYHSTQPNPTQSKQTIPRSRKMEIQAGQCHSGSNECVVTSRWTDG